LKKGRQGKQDQESNHDKQEEEEPEVSVDTGKDRRENFTTNQIYEALKELAEQYREKPRLYNMLRSREPEKKDEEVILIRLENPLQDQQIKKIYGTVLIHLKNYLQNDYITLKTEIVDDQSKDNNKLYTDEDKYQYMEKKNQDLRQLKQDFDLDFD
jgi:DNA polymerase-3 subunit gamma/tau